MPYYNRPPSAYHCITASACRFSTLSHRYITRRPYSWFALAPLSNASAGPVSPPGGTIPSAWQAVFRSDRISYYLGPDGLVSAMPVERDGVPDVPSEPRCFQQATTGPINGTLGDEPVKFYALLFNHFPGRGAGTCYLLFVSPAGAPLGIAVIDRFYLTPNHCLDASQLEGAALSAASFSLSEQTVEPYVPPPDCADYAVDGTAVARWLQGTAVAVDGTLQGDFSTASGHRVVIEPHSILLSHWFDRLERICVRSVQNVPQRAVMSSTGTGSSPPNGEYSQILLAVWHGWCMRYTRNLTAGVDIVVESRSNFVSAGAWQLPVSSCRCYTLSCGAESVRRVGLSLASPSFFSCARFTSSLLVCLGSHCSF